MKPVVDEFANGLKVVLVPNHASHVVAFQMWVGVGAADEKKGEEGLAHVFEHMIFKGTKKRAVGEITRDVERVGGQINAWTSPDETVFYITLASRYWAKGLDILADAMTNPALDANELKSELQVIREEIRMGEDSPDRTVTRSLFKSLFKKHPYGRPVIGYDRVVKGFTRKDVINFYNKWYVPKNMILAVAGDFDVAAMQKKTRSLLANLPKGKNPPARVTRIKEPLQKKPRISYGTKPVSEAHLALGYPIPGLNHEDIPALDLLAAIVGQGASSRLETDVRRKEGTVNGVRAMSYTPVDAGLFGVFSTMPPKNLETATKSILRELNRLTTEPVQAKEIEKARTLLESDKVYSEETVDGIARKLGFYCLHAKDVEFEDKYLLSVSRLGPGDLLKVARKYLKPEALNVATVLPDPSVPLDGPRLPWIKGKASARKLDGKKLVGMFTKNIAALEKAAPKTKTVSPKNEIVVHKLSTGDVLIVRTDPSSKLVAARAAFWGGSRLETPAKSGISALLANTLTKGAGGLSSEEVATQLDSMACSIDGFSGRNTLGVSGEFLKRNFEDGFSLMAKCLRDPSLLSNEVALEKALLKEDIKASLHNPGYVAFNLFARTLFGSHPYGRPAWGTEETIDSFTTGTLRRHLKNTTASGGMVMAVEGGADLNTVIELVENEFLVTGKKNSLKKALKNWKEPESPIQVTEQMPKEQSHVVLGFKGTKITSPHRFALEMMTEILGGHGGRLFETVREKKGLAYSVTAMALSGVEPGYIALYAATSPGKEQAVSDAMLEELDRIRQHSVPAKELFRVKRHLVGARAIARQRAGARAANTALDYLYGNGPDEAEHFSERIDAVTADDIRKVAQKFLNPKKRVVICVGPDVKKLSLV